MMDTTTDLLPFQCGECRQFGDSGGCRNQACVRSRPLHEQVAVAEAALRDLVASVLKLERGCDCEYDYRCHRCDRLISVREKAAALSAKVA